MPRRPKPIEIQRQRAKNYAFHYSERGRFQALPEDMRKRLVEISRSIPFPAVDLWGTSGDAGFWTLIFEVGYRHGLDDDLSGLLHPWYTDDGWSAFQEMYKSLPEPVEFIQIPVDNWPVLERSRV